MSPKTTPSAARVRAALPLLGAAAPLSSASLSARASRSSADRAPPSARAVGDRVERSAASASSEVPSGTPERLLGPVCAVAGEAQLAPRLLGYELLAAECRRDDRPGGRGAALVNPASIFGREARLPTRTRSAARSRCSRPQLPRSLFGESSNKPPVVRRRSRFMVQATLPGWKRSREERDAHDLRQLVSEREFAIAHAHGERSAERFSSDELELDARCKPVVGQVAEHRGFRVRDSHEGPAIARLQVGEDTSLLSFDDAVAGGDRVAVRVVDGVPELVGDALLELFGEHVLEDFGLAVHAIPGNVELVGEEPLEQPMMADDLERHP